MYEIERSVCDVLAGKRSAQMAYLKAEKWGTRRGSDEANELIDRFVRDVPQELVIGRKGNGFLRIHVEVADTHGCHTRERIDGWSKQPEWLKQLRGARFGAEKDSLDHRERLAPEGFGYLRERRKSKDSYD